MLRLLIISSILLFTIFPSIGQTSISNGDWGSGAFTTSPGFTGLGGQNITINHDVTVGSNASRQDLEFVGVNDSRSITINNGKSLVIYGDVSFANRAMDLIIGDATVIILGNLSIANKLDLNTNGRLVVTGTFSKSGSGGQGNFTGTGAVYAGSYGGSADGFIPGDESGGTQQLIDPDLSNDSDPNGDLAEILEFLNNGGNTPLPVTLKKFNASTEASSTILNWTTLTEENFDFFEIHRADEHQQFAIIGTVKGNGSTKEEINYTWSDENPKLGLNYYKLTSVDYDGYRESFPTVALLFEPEDKKVAITPSVITQNIRPVLKNTFGQQFTITILNLQGQVVYHKTNDGSDNYLDIDPELKSGIYIARYTVNGLMRTQKILIE